MPALANPRHELFAQAVASGNSASEAYRQSGATGKNADVHAGRLMVNDGICKRISEIREEQAAKCEMTKDQFRQFLVSVMVAKPEDANFQNPLCELAMTKAGPAAVFPSKLGAAIQLAKLTGWNEVEKVSVEAGDTLSASCAKSSPNSAMDLSEIEKFRDPIFRTSNLYSIRERGGKVIPFRPRPQQSQVLDMIFRRGLKRIVILKARQIGFSTLLGVICADQLCWNTGKQISLVDKTQEDARQKLKNITMLAYDSLHPDLKERFVVSRANSGEFGVRFFEYEEAQTSTMFAGTHARGGSNFFVWISEWGVIQAEDLRRSEEILTGAIPSAKDGLVVVETTWRGGRGGHLWDIVKKALETPEEQKHADDWRVVFFPWQHDPAYCDAEPQRLKEETVRYFSDKPGFSDGQKSWYQKARDQFGLFTLREFPTVLEECFQTPVEGAIYAEIIDRLRAQGAIQRAEVDSSALVHTAWDLGSPLNTVTWFFQIVGPEIRVIDCDSDLDLTPVQRVAGMLAKGYLYGSHFLPHDAMATMHSGKTFLTELGEVGLRNCKVVPRTHDIWVGINRLRQILPRFTFRIPACERGLEAVSNYRTVRTTSTGLAVDEPVHDWSSHAASALKVIAEAEAAHMLSSAGSTPNIHRQPVTVRTGFRGNSRDDSSDSDILDRFFGPSRPHVRVLR